MIDSGKANSPGLSRTQLYAIQQIVRV